MRKSIWIVLILLLFDCKKDDFQPSSEETCRLGRFVYGQQSGADVSYQINYLDNSQTWVDLVTDQLQVGDQWATSNIYKHIYRNDSVYIKDFRAFKEGTTYLAAIYPEENSQIQSVITTFPDAGGTYRYSFDYSKSDQVTVRLERMEGNVATFDSQGVYHLDENNNVIKLEITRNPALHGSDPDPYTSRTITMTYDIVINPLKGLILPHFLKPVLPDATYFSMENRLDATYDGATKTYVFEYGTDPMPTKETLPDGTVYKFEYPNCTN